MTGLCSVMPSQAANDRRVGQMYSAANAVFVTAVSLMLVLVLCAGCKQRRVARTTPQMDAESRFWIRVRLLNDVNECTVRVLSPSRLISTSSSAGEAIYLDQFTKETRIHMSDGHIRIAGLALPDTGLSIYPEGPHIFEINGDDYRGVLKLVVDHNEGTFDLINWVPLEPYLAGVIGAEMPDYWESEALKAQATAARTYCLYIKERFGQSRTWDVGKTQAHQVYRGVAAESAQIWNAVNQTSGKILMCERADGSEGIFPAYYSSTCGGHTEDSVGVFGKSDASIPGVPCTFGRNVAKANLFEWPEVRFPKKEVSRVLLQRYPALRELEDIAKIVVTEKSDYAEFSRATRIDLTGPNGKSDWLRAEDLRLAIDPTGRRIKSAGFEIKDKGSVWAFGPGRGFGHGVGMCQCGAEGMARAGNSAEKILAHYFPESHIVDIYAPENE